MEFMKVLAFLPDVSAALMVAVFIIAIFFHLRKTSKSESAETTVYVLLTREVERLNRENTQLKMELEVVRQQLAEERMHYAEEMSNVKRMVYELQTELQIRRSQTNK
jgi:uncharacterized protein YlxW (UPF0749 family)